MKRLIFAALLAPMFARVVEDSPSSSQPPEVGSTNPGELQPAASTGLNTDGSTSAAPETPSGTADASATLSEGSAAEQTGESSAVNATAADSSALTASGTTSQTSVDAAQDSATGDESNTSGPPEAGNDLPTDATGASEPTSASEQLPVAPLAPDASPLSVLVAEPQADGSTRAVLTEVDADANEKASRIKAELHTARNHLAVLEENVARMVHAALDRIEQLL